MPSSAASAYKDILEGKLITSVSTGTTTGVRVKVKQINGSTPTWTTVAHRLKVIQRTATNNKAEVWQVAAGTTQSGQTVTLGTLTRALPLSDGTDFTGSGTAQSFSAGADVFLAWDAHDAAMTPKLDIANTFTADQTFSAGIALTGTTKTLQVAQMTTTQRDAIATPANGMIIYNTTTSVMNQYIGGTWTTFATGSVSNATNAAAGKVDIATVAEIAAATALDATSGASNALVVANTAVNSASSNWASGAIPALNTAKLLDGSLGGTGVASPVLGALLIGGGAGSAMTAIGPGSSGQVPMSNGTTLAMTTPTQYMIPFTPIIATSTALTNPTSATSYDTHTYTIPANFLTATSWIEFEFTFTITHGTSGVFNSGIFLAGSSALSTAFTAINGGNSGVLRGTIMGTAAAGASVAVRISLIGGELGAGGSAKYGTSTQATNGTIALAFSGAFDTSNGSNVTAGTMSIVRKCSSVLF